MTDDDLNDLVDYWHSQAFRYQPCLEDYIIMWTHWTHEQYETWVVTGELPNGQA